MIDFITWLAIAGTSALAVFHFLSGNYAMSVFNIALGALFCKVMGVRP